MNNCLGEPSYGSSCILGQKCIAPYLPEVCFSSCFDINNYVCVPGRKGYKLGGNLRESDGVFKASACIPPQLGQILL